jgi:pSer/pThr/pTyr-binding forkhead associated (FHA) protein
MFPLPRVETVTIGRWSDQPHDLRPMSILVLSKPMRGLSCQHIRITRRGELIYVCDLGSTNGRFLNRRRLSANQDRLLRCGDVLRLGRLQLRVRFEQ